MSNVPELRKQLLEKMLKDGVRQNLPEPQYASVVPYPLIKMNIPDLPYFSGYPNGTIWDWDQYFEAILQLHAGVGCEYIKNGVLYFLYNMQPDGFIPRYLPYTSMSAHTMAKPFLIQQALLTVKAGFDHSWLIYENYYRLKHYLNYWLNVLDIRKHGLSIWADAGHTGMDNQYERAGYPFDSYCEGVDLNCYLVRECEAMAKLSELIGMEPEGRFYKKLADLKRKMILKWCWHEDEGFLYDYNAKLDSKIKVKHSGVFAALWAKVLDQEKAERLVKEHLLNKDEFWRVQPIPGYAATEPGYLEMHRAGDRTGCSSWRAHSWIPVNYYTFQGLRYYGFEKEAADLAKKSEAMFVRAPFSEYFYSDRQEGCGKNPFLGWSGLALYMCEELDKNIDMTEI